MRDTSTSVIIRLATITGPSRDPDASSRTAELLALYPST